VVAICDHLGFFLYGQRKYEVLREPLQIALDLLNEAITPAYSPISAYTAARARAAASSTPTF